MSTAEREFGYQPALDGVRAVAVAMVLVFHLDLGFYDGGYLGVSVFFTLSGFLITSLLIRERSRTGRISPKAFYLRRVRRLLPASLLCIAAVAVLGAAGLYDRSGDLRPNVFGALFQVQNWVSLARDQSYADLFAAPSPLDHFWSLAIEEQFYWVWPLTVAAIAAFAAKRGQRKAGGYLLPLLALFVVTSISAPLTRLLLDGDAVYFASWTRVAEILAGAVLAALLAHRTLPRRGAAALAWVCMILVLLAGAVFPAGRGFAYDGGLPLFALVSAGLIAGLQVPSTLRAGLSTWPFVALGRISFGVYLYHWPVFVLLDGTRTDLDRWPLAALRLAVTFAISITSFHLLERPIRERRVLAAAPRIVGALGVAILCVAAFTVLAVARPDATDAFEDDIAGADTLAPADSLAPLVPLTTAVTTSVTESSGVASTATDAPTSTSTRPGATPATDGSATTESPPSTGAPTTPAPTQAPTTVAPTVTPITEIVPPRPVRMLVVGDSTAQALGNGIAAWALERPDLAEVEVMAFPGCGLLDGGDRFFGGDWVAVPEGCSTLYDVEIPARVREARPDLVVVVTSFWDVTDHRWPDDGGVTRTPFDEVFAQRLEERFREFNEALLGTADATKVVWVQYPSVDYQWEDADEPADDPLRYDVLASSIRDAAEVDDASVRVVEFAEWVRDEQLDASRDARPDGVHFTLESATDATRVWLGRELIVSALM